MKNETTIYAAIVYFFIMSYKHILMFQGFTLLDHKKYKTYSILRHSFTLTVIFHYDFVDCYGFYGNIMYEKTTQLKLLL